jgi:hypothetical protein
VKAALAAALASGTAGRDKLAPEDWRMLAYYSWVTDEQQLAPGRSSLQPSRLAKACPADQTDTATRLELQALAAAACYKGKAAPAARAVADRVLAVLADDERAPRRLRSLTNYAGSIAGYVAPGSSPVHSRLVAAWNSALDRFIPDRACHRRSARRNQREDRAREARPPTGPLPDALLGKCVEAARRPRND